MSVHQYGAGVSVPKDDPVITANPDPPGRKMWHVLSTRDPEERIKELLEANNRYVEHIRKLRRLLEQFMTSNEVNEAINGTF